MQIPFRIKNIGEVDFLINYFEANIGNFDLPGLSNNFIDSVPSIGEAHPLSLLFESEINSEGEAYTGMLPAIGVELINDSEHDRQNMGETEAISIVDQSFIDEADVPIKERLEKGIIISDKNIQNIKDIIATQKLYALKNMKLFDQELNISIWSTHISVTKVLYDCFMSMTQMAKKQFKKSGAKQIVLNGSGSLYNYDFSQTLYGREIKMRFVQHVRDYVADDSVSQIGQIDLVSTFVNIGRTDSYTKSTSTTGE
jgi:hypothetical protein